MEVSCPPRCTASGILGSSRRRGPIHELMGIPMHRDHDSPRHALVGWLAGLSSLRRASSAGGVRSSPSIGQLPSRRFGDSNKLHIDCACSHCAPSGGCASEVWCAGDDMRDPAYQLIDQQPLHDPRRAAGCRRPGIQLCTYSRYIVRGCLRSRILYFPGLGVKSTLEKT
jgi:hypothetical protein